MTDRIGQQLGNYRLLRLLGQGGFAQVYLGEHVYLKTLAAIKLLRLQVISQEDLESFLKEAQTIVQLVHLLSYACWNLGWMGQHPFSRWITRPAAVYVSVIREEHACPCPQL